MTNRALQPIITQTAAKKLARSVGDFLALSDTEKEKFIYVLRERRVSSIHREANAETVVKLKRGKKNAKTKEVETDAGEKDGSPAQEAQVHTPVKNAKDDLSEGNG